MHCIDFFVISKFCVKQLAIFERTVVAASDLKKTVRWSTVFQQYYHCQRECQTLDPDQVRQNV